MKVFLIILLICTSSAIIFLLSKNIELIQDSSVKILLSLCIAFGFVLSKILETKNPKVDNNDIDEIGKY